MSTQITLAINSFACGALAMAFLVAPRWLAWMTIVPAFITNAAFVALFLWGNAA